MTKPLRMGQPTGTARATATARVFWVFERAAAFCSSCRNRDHSCVNSEGGQGREERVRAVKVDGVGGCCCFERTESDDTGSGAFSARSDLLNFSYGGRGVES